jgi:hypothetical protein
VAVIISHPNATIVSLQKEAPDPEPAALEQVTRILGLRSYPAKVAGTAAMISDHHSPGLIHPICPSGRR